MTKDGNINTDPSRDRLLNRKLPPASRAALIVAGLMVTLTLTACGPAEPDPGDTAEAAQQNAPQAYSPSMGENNAKSKTQRPDNFTACPDPRPEMCTQQYAPACGYFYADEEEDGKDFRTFGNHCTACQNEAVEGYVQGECPD